MLKARNSPIRPQVISDAFKLPEIEKMLKARNSPILDLGKYAKLKGVLDDPMASLHAIAGTVLKQAFIIPQFSCYPWSTTPSPEQTEFLFSEIDCQWEIFLSLRRRDSLGLPLLPIQAVTDGQLVTLVQGCKRIAEGSIVGHQNSYLDAIMDTSGNTKRLNVSLTRSLIVISKLHTRGEIAPAVVNAVARTFAVPAPPSSVDDSVEFSVSESATQLPNSSPLEFEHWSPETADDQLVFGLLRKTLPTFGLLNPNVMRDPDAMEGIEMSWHSGRENVSLEN
ncbi:hypothetical protein B0H14DRAFT_2602720 [Mycena olivaceomarginata]|nr:hypothetical protein B0H14DRAFT_2602720 [Mycena olivaceomarginata]